MFCPNCGNEIPIESNYCPICGKKLKDVKVTVIDALEKKDTKTKNNEESKNSTRVFQPIKNLDGIDNTNEISEIIKAVDEQITENIHKYETNSYAKEDIQKELKKEVSNKKVSENITKDKKKDNKMAKSKKEIDNKPPKNTNSIKKEETKKTNNKSSNNKEINNAKKVNSNSSTVKEDNSNKKFDLKKLWKNFINEDKDEYSIFSSYDDEKENKTKEDHIELSTSSTSSDTSTSVNTDTMGIPKIALENEIKKAEEKIVKKEETKKNKVQPEKTISKDTVKKKSETIEKPKQVVKNEKPKLKDPEEKISHKSFTDQVNEELKKLEMENSKKDSSKEKEHIKKDKKEKSEKENKFFENLKSKRDNKKVSEKNSKLKFSFNKEGFYNLMDWIVIKLDKLDLFILKDGKKSFTITAIIGILLSFIPIVVATRRPTFSIFILLLFKLLFNILEFYIPLNIVTEKVWVETSEDEVKYFAFMNWFICQVFLFVAFFLSPWNGLFTFKLLPALTPQPIGTIMMFIIALLVTLGQYWNQIKKENKVNFIGWYSISFMLIHFLSKIFFVMTNLIG